MHKILAKPSGVTLTDHRSNVLYEGQALFNAYPFVFKKYEERIGKNLKKRLDYAIRFHDDGKRLKKWQDACQADYLAFLEWQKKNHGDYNEYCLKNPNSAGAHLRTAGVRHEFQSLFIHTNKNLPLCLPVAIAAHHGKLGFRHEKRWMNESAGALWNQFRRESNRVLDEKMTLAQVAHLHYEYAGPRGLLQLADHRASAQESGHTVPPFIPFKYKFPHREKRNIQKLVEKYWQDDLLLVRAATGSGKTDAALLWASKQIDNGRADRLVIAMPTRFTSNALSINVAESLSENGLYHSSAWFNKYHEKVETGEILRNDAVKEHEFARLLQTPVTVCTIDHLLISLTLTREDHHLITFNLAHSCVVIDEADFYDDFTQANILVLLEMLKYWHVPVLLMSASLPESILPRYRDIGFSISDIKEDKFDVHEYSRTRFKIRSIEECETPMDVDLILKRCLKYKKAIIYANTIERAIAFHKWFENNAKGIKTCLYHSRFTEPDKARKEAMLIEMLGKNAWQGGNANGIAILTQIGEMSINISADIMISDLCPIDRLTQRVGRLCRFTNSGMGELHILLPKKDSIEYPAPYGTYNRILKRWMASIAMNKTRELLDCTTYSTQDLVNLINRIYGDLSEFTESASNNANTLKNYFKTNWLILPEQISQEDDGDTTFWRSRNIPRNDTVFITKPEVKYFNNYLSFQHWKLTHGVDLPIYLIERGISEGILLTVDIFLNSEKESIVVMPENLYSFEKGVHIIESDQIL